MRRTSYLKSALAGGACMLALISSAFAETRDFNIPAGDLGTALDAYIAQSGVQLIYKIDDVKGVKTRGARGALSTDDALARLVKGTAFEIHHDSSGAVAIVPVTADGEPPPRPKRLGDAGQASPSEPGVEEIVVTAQKREERLKDVPVPVTVVGAEKLAANAQVTLHDYYNTVPGLAISTTGAQAFQTIVIRGITTSNGNPTVGITVDDVPFGASTIFGQGNALPEVDPGDLARIEVLRGPQGTLYGANSMGGLVKFVTKDPSTDGYSGRVEGGTSSVYNGAQPGFNLRGSANIPLSESLAIRVSGFRRQDPGYIDNPVFKLKGVNEVQADGARLAAMWQPSDTISLKLGALYQHIDGGYDSVDVPIVGVPETTGLTGLEQNYAPGVGNYQKEYQAYSAILKAQLGGIELTSLTGYNVNRYKDSWDFTADFGSITQAVFGVRSTPVTDHVRVSKVSQELRLAGSLWEKFDWLVGAFYTHENTSYKESILAENPNTGAYVGTWVDWNFPSKYQEYAGFADFTYHVMDRFDIQVGARESHITVSDALQTSVGILNGTTAPVITPGISSSDNAFTYLFSPRFKISSDFMIYARLSSGYRPGGPILATTPGTPLKYGPDRTENYEIGVKGDFFEHVVSIDASAYYIDWTNLQVQTRQGAIAAYTANLGNAKSEGVELSVSLKPATGLTIAGWIDYDNAILTKAFPSGPAYGVVGSPLPLSSKWSGYISVSQDFPLWHETIGSIGAEVSFVGDRLGNFGATPQRANYPAYTQINLHAGVKYDTWAVNLYATNVTDRRGVIGGGVGSYPSQSIYYIRPRTVGLNLTKTF